MTDLDLVRTWGDGNRQWLSNINIANFLPVDVNVDCGSKCPQEFVLDGRLRPENSDLGWFGGLWCFFFFWRGCRAHSKDDPEKTCCPQFEIRAFH